MAEQGKAAAAARLASGIRNNNRTYAGGVFQTGSAPFGFAAPAAPNFNLAADIGAQNLAPFEASHTHGISELDIARPMPDGLSARANIRGENVGDRSGNLEDITTQQRIPEATDLTPDGPAYPGSIFNDQLPREDTRPVQLMDGKADNGKNGDAPAETTTQEEYEKIRNESRFEMTTRNGIEITGGAPSFYRIPGEGVSSVFDSGFIMRAPDGRYVRYPPGSSVEQYLSGRVIIKDPSGRVRAEYRSS